MSANGNDASNPSINDEVSRSSLNESHAGNTNHGSPLTETASVTHDPTDFSDLIVDELEDDEGILETHSQNSILNNTTDNSRRYIKRPLNAYMLWTRRARDGILKANPHLKMNEVSKTMGEMWKKMADEAKKPFFKEAREKAMKHKKALEKHPELAYVPSRKKTKRGEKPPDEPIHKDAKNARVNSPTPSASPHTPTVRQGFAHPGHIIDSGRAYPQQNIVRPANSTPFQGGVQYQQPNSSGPMSFAQPLPQQVRYVTTAPISQSGQQMTYSNGAPANQQAVFVNSAFQPTSLQGQSVHFLPNSRDPGAYLVRNPYVIPRTDPSEPIYEAESPDVYKELYYRSLVQLQLPTKYGPNERESLAPELYLQRYYTVGGTDPPREASKSTNNANGLVYQEL